MKYELKELVIHTETILGDLSHLEYILVVLEAYKTHQLNWINVQDHLQSKKSHVLGSFCFIHNNQ